MNERPLIVYHGNCIDGFTAAWACWKRFGDDAEYFAAQYGSNGADVELPDVTGRDVVMVDFCTGRDQLLCIHAAAKSFIVLDHHKTAEAACAGLGFCTFDMERSGAGLAWDALHRDYDREDSPSYGQPRPRPWIVDYVEDRDLWRFKLPGSKAINAFISAQPVSFQRWSAVAKHPIVKACEAGDAVLSFVDRYVHEMAAQARRGTFAGYADIPIVNAPYINTSELVGHMAESALFAVGWFQRGDGMYQYSLRSRGDFDVSAIAKSFGGGGHKNAAGFAVAERVTQ
jgi:hypothetical protein